jgi:hypothetical protein
VFPVLNAPVSVHLLGCSSWSIRNSRRLVESSIRCAFAVTKRPHSAMAEQEFPG